MSDPEELRRQLRRIADRIRAPDYLSEEHKSLKSFVMEEGQRDFVLNLVELMLTEGERGLRAYGSMNLEVGLVLGLRYAYEHGFPDWVGDLATPEDPE